MERERRAGAAVELLPMLSLSRRAPCAQVEVSRFNGFLSTEAAAAKAEGAAEVSLWAPGARTAAARKHPLAMYDVRTSGSIGKGKGLVDPNEMACYEARSPPCPRTSAPCLLLPTESHGALRPGRVRRYIMAGSGTLIRTPGGYPRRRTASSSTPSAASCCTW